MAHRPLMLCSAELLQPSNAMLLWLDLTVVRSGRTPAPCCRGRSVLSSTRSHQSNAIL